MATIQVRMPDGSMQAMSHPDDWTDDQVKSAIYKNFPQKTHPQATEESLGQKALRYGVKDPIVGVAELGNAVLNIPHGLGKLLGVNIPGHEEGYDYSAALGIPEDKKNLTDKLIQFAPDLMTSLALPETKLGAIGRSIERIPEAGKYLKTALGNALSQGGYASVMSPENKGSAALEAGGIAAPFSALSKAALSGSPILKTASRLGLGVGGGILGYHGAKAIGAGDTTSDLVGALIGLTGAKGLNAEKSALKGVDNTNYQPVLSASRRLNLPYITPAEASDNPFTGATQGTIGKTEGGSQLLYEKSKEREGAEKSAIKNLYDSVTPSNTVSASSVREAANSELNKMKQDRLNASEEYYKKAHEKKVAPSWVTNLENSDETIKNAISDAMSDPKYQKEGELKGLPKNSIKVLDYAKRKIDSQIEQAKNFGDNDAVRVLTNSKNTLMDKISSVDQDYKSGRDIYAAHSKPIEDFENSQLGTIAKTENTGLKRISSMIFDPLQTDISVLRNIKDTVQKHDPEAWNGIIKNEMKRLMKGAKNINGNSFNNRVLSDENVFNQLKVALEDNPIASEMLDDMKTVFPRLIGTDTAKSAAGLARTSMSKPRESTSPIMTMFKELLSGGRYDKNAVKTITDPNWEKRIEKMKSLSNLDKIFGHGANIVGKAGAQTIAQ